MQNLDHNAHEYMSTLVGELSHQYQVGPVNNHNIEYVVEGLSFIVVQPLRTDQDDSIKRILAPLHEKHCASAAASGEWKQFDARNHEDLEVAKEYLSMFKDKK